MRLRVAKWRGFYEVLRIFTKFESYWNRLMKIHEQQTNFYSYAHGMKL